MERRGVIQAFVDRCRGKAVDRRVPVGGEASAGNAWLRQSHGDDLSRITACHQSNGLEIGTAGRSVHWQNEQQQG